MDTRRPGTTAGPAAPPHLLDEKGILMKKQAMLTAVAGLLTLASVAVLPALAQDTGGQPYSPPQKRTEYSRHYGEHERYGKGEQRDHNDYRYGKGEQRDHNDYRYGKGEQRDRDDYRYGKGERRDHDDYRYGKGGSKGSGGYGYSSYGKGGSQRSGGYGYSSYGRSGSGS